MKPLTKYLIPFSLIIFCALNGSRLYADDPLDDFPKPLGAEWAQVYPEASGRSIVAIPSGYVVAGRQNGPTDSPLLDYWTVLVRYNLDGTFSGSEDFSSETDHNEAFDILASYDGEDNLDGYIITGARHTEHNNGDEIDDLPDMWLMKTNTSFVKQWESTFGDYFSDFGYATIHDGTGFIISGRYTNPNESGYLVRTDASGTMTWEASYGTETRWEFMPVIYSSAPAHDGGLIVATDHGLQKLGTYTPTTRPSDEAEWWASTSDVLKSVIAVSGGYVATGYVEVSGDANHLDLVLIKVNTDGSEAWRHTFGRFASALGATGMNDYGEEVIQTADGGFAVIGTTQSYAWHGTNDMWLIKTDENGVMQWDMAMGDTEGDFGRGIVEDAANDLVACGTTNFDDGTGGGLTNWIYVVSVSGNFAPPHPSFTYSPESPLYIQENVHFDATGTTPGGGEDEIELYEWDFGDGNSGSGITANHIYIAPGTYTATLYVTDSNGIRRETSQTVTAVELAQQWERTFGNGQDWYYDLSEVEDGNFLLCGINCITTSNCSTWVAKVDAWGNTLWTGTYPDIYANGRDGAHRGILGNDGNYVIAGMRDKATAGSTRDVRIIKLAADDGEKLWDVSFDKDGAGDEAYDIKAVPSDGYVVAAVGSTTAWMLKINESGEMEWDGIYSNTGDLSLQGLAVAPSEDGGYLMVCSRYGSFSSDPFFAIKTDADGVEINRQTITTTGEAGGRWVTEALDGGYAIAGMRDDDFGLIKLDGDGDFDWSSTWGNDSDRNYIYDADTAPDGGYIMVGTLYTPETDDDTYVVRTDSEGNVAWELTIGEEGKVGGENGQAVAYLPDGSIVILHTDYYDAVTRLTKIGPNMLPTGDFTFDPVDVLAGEPVTFTSDVDDEDGTITHMTWQFGTGEGDPETTTSSTIDHTYTRSGTYTVTLTAYDNSGGELIVTHDVTVTGEVVDNCPDDPDKIEPGVCGCGVPDTDTDTDGTPDCIDNCPDDINKTEPGICGCGVADTDTDLDGTADCNDGCPADENKTAPGDCGCGEVDTDTDSDGTADCIDECPDDPDKIAAGTCGCGVADTDTDSDGTPDCNDNCPDDPDKTEPGTCGCGVSDADTDGDGTLDCEDACPDDGDKTEPGICGCGTPDIDTDSDGTLDCNDNCPDDPDKTEPGTCGCGVEDTDTDTDGTPDCLESGPDGTDPGYDGNGDGDADSTQDFVASLNAYDDSGYVTIASPDSTTLSSVTAEDNPAPADPEAPDATDFPYGFFSFTISDVTPGGSTTVTIYLPSGATPSTYWKYGPTPGTPAPHWYEFLYDAGTNTGAEFSGNVITLHFVDGQRGDDDLDATNGIIVDIGAPGSPIPSSGGNGGGGGGGGCFISELGKF